MALHTLPELPYGYGALEPHIDGDTMVIHHRHHHQGHVDRLNATLAQLDPSLRGLSVEELLRNIDQVPEDSRSAIRNHGGGHANHSLFWTLVAPGGSAPSGALAEAIDETFGSFEAFKGRFSVIAANHFGSGWIWLITTRGKLVVYTLPNQDSPLLVREEPLLALDLWEHAYCGRPGWRQPDHVESFWNVANWDEVGRRYEAARQSSERRCHKQPA
ncbi:MAG: superoxide dismutase [Acidimicrobiia bacterium]